MQTVCALATNSFALVPIHSVPTHTVTVHDNVFCMQQRESANTQMRKPAVVFVNYQLQFRTLKWVAMIKLLTPNRTMENISYERNTNFCWSRKHDIEIVFSIQIVNRVRLDLRTHTQAIQKKKFCSFLWTPHMQSYPGIILAIGTFHVSWIMIKLKLKHFWHSSKLVE